VTIFMNLDTLPYGRSMYTVFLTWDPKGTPRDQMSAEEIDVIADRSAHRELVARDGMVNGDTRTCGQVIAEDYEPGARVIGVVNQSDGYTVYDAFAAGDETP
jgi:hypothetical protein